MEELLKIQSELKAPKNQFNKFGNYKYRNAEDILEAVKPLLVKYKCLMTITDEIKQVGDRFYVEATVRITNEAGAGAEVKAFAREEETKKGMDGSQITGASSSYARKYALNGLFLIDDTKDVDSNEQRQEREARTVAQESATKTTPAQKEKILTDLCIKTSTDPIAVMKAYKVKKFEDMNDKQFNDCVSILEGRL